MKLFLYSWIVSLLLIIMIDSIWFSMTANGFYKVYLSHVFTKDFNYIAALIFYLLYSFGITYLVIIPGLQQRLQWTQILCQGLVIGLMVYGAYDLTNHATIKDWPMIVTVIDILWGAAVTSTVGVITYKILLSMGW